MMSLKALSITAALALALPATSFAQNPPPGQHPAARGPAPGGHPAGGGPRPGPSAAFHAGGGPGGGGYRGGYRNGAFIPGAVAGAVVGGAIASESYGYYNDPGPGYYAPGYYDDQSYDDNGVVAVGPGPGGDDAVAYCMQTYRSYDPQSGTYLGFDGLRHRCP